MLKPSARRHVLWASIHFVQASSPCSTMHSSRSFFVSGQAQQIFFFGLVSKPDFMTADPWFGCEAGRAKAEEVLSVGSPPMSQSLQWIKTVPDRKMQKSKKHNGKKKIRFSTHRERKSNITVHQSLEFVHLMISLNHVKKISNPVQKQTVYLTKQWTRIY